MTEQRSSYIRPSFLTAVVWCILFTETAERFSYFGFRAVLVLYFKHKLEFDDATAVALFAYVTSLAYFSPLLGALLADGSLGRYKTILWFGWLYAVGLSILTAGAYLDGISLKRGLTFAGLFLVCIGTGGIKPCVSAFGADQVACHNQAELVPSSEHSEMRIMEASDETTNDGVHHDFHDHPGLHSEETVPQADPQNSDQVRAFFAYFYFCINVGALTSIFLVPILKIHFGFGTAFLAPTILLFLALAAFLSKRKEYVHHVPGEGESSLANTFRLCWFLFRQQLELKSPRLLRMVTPWGRHRHVLIRNEDDFRDEQQGTPAPVGDNLAPEMDTLSAESEKKDSETLSSMNESRQKQVSDAKQALHIMPILALIPIFWMLYDQQGSVWTLQASRMKLYWLQPEQLNIVNPVEIMIFIPLFDRCIYPALERRKYNLSHLRRMSWGMVFCATSFFVSGLVESQIQAREPLGEEGKVPIWWQVPQITILAVGEIFLSVTAYDFVYTNSPASMKAFLMAVYLLTTAVGNFFGGILYSSVFRSINGAAAMHICAFLMLCNFGLFFAVARWWESCTTNNDPEYEMKVHAAVEESKSTPRNET